MAYWRVPMAHSTAPVQHQYAIAARQHDASALISRVTSKIALRVRRRESSGSGVATTKSNAAGV